MIEKCCCQCKLVKPVSEFHRNRSKPDGLRENCKTCRREKYDKNRDKILSYNVEWNHKNKDRIKFHNRKRVSTVEGRARSLWLSAKERARTKNLTFDLPIERIILALKLGVCERTGISFVLTPHEEAGMNHRFAPSLDRIDRKLGYTVDNIAVVVWQYNIGKAIYSHEEFLEFCRMFVSKNECK